MTLRRPTSNTAFSDVLLTAASYGYNPDQLQAGVQAGDARVETLNDEIAAASWPGPPRKQDVIVIDGATWRVQGVMAVRAGTLLLGYSLWVGGGAP